MQKVEQSTAALKAMQYMTRKEGSQDRSAAHFQNLGHFDLPSGKHAKSKSVNKFSQPELARYNNSVERIIGESSQTMQQTTPGLVVKDKRPNYTLHGQGHVQVKQSLQQKTTKQADLLLNSAYNMNKNNRKQQVKGNQHISKKLLQGGSFPNSLN